MFSLFSNAVHGLVIHICGIVVKKVTLRYNKKPFRLKTFYVIVINHTLNCCLLYHYSFYVQ